MSIVILYDLFALVAAAAPLLAELENPFVLVSTKISRLRAAGGKIHPKNGS